MPKAKHTILIAPGGDLTSLHDDRFAAMKHRLAEAGERELSRASHVEPGRELNPTALSILARRGDYAHYATATESSPDQVVLRDDLASRWFADMTPAGFTEVLGPFESREQALAAEHEYLEKHLIRGQPAAS